MESSNLWHGMRARYKLTDLTNGPTSYSEAPAVSVFSVWERVSSGRGSLTIQHTVALVRMAMEGPMAATKDSLDLSKTALAKWPGHLGERFTTTGWFSGMVSKKVSQIQSGKK